MNYIKTKPIIQHYSTKKVNAVALVKDGSISMEEFAEKMGKMSGRELAIDSISKAFKALMEVLRPIHDAFREIFPATTAEQLYSLMESINAFTDKLKISDETANNIKRTFAGLFAALDIGRMAVVFLVKSFAELVGAVLPVGDGVLAVTANIGDFIVGIRNAIKEGAIFGKAFGKVHAVILAVKSALSAVKDAFFGFGKIDFSGFKAFTDEVDIQFRPFTSLANGLSNAFDLIIVVIKKVKVVFEEVAKVVGKALQALYDVVSDSFGDRGLAGVIDLVNTVLLGGILFNAREFVDNVTGIFEGVKNNLEAFQRSLDAKTLLTIATAIAVLAGALTVLSMIDPVKLTTSLGAVTVLFTELTASMKLMDTSIGVFKGMALPGIMIGMSVAILILSAALKNLADLDWEGVAKGTVGITALMTETLLFINLVNPTKLLSTGVAMIAIGAAMNILADAVEKLGTLDVAVLVKGLTAMAVVLGEMTLFINLIDPKKIFSTGIAMIAMGEALKIMSDAVEALGTLDILVLVQGLTAMGVILAELGVFINLIDPKKILSTGIAMIAMGEAMRIFADAIGQMGEMKAEEIAKGLIAMGGALGIIVAATNLMPKDVGGKAVSLLVLSAALLVLAEALQNMGGMKPEEVATSLIVLAGALTIIAIATNLMSGSLAGAAAMLVISVGLIALSAALKTLGSMNLTEIGIALLALVGVFAVVGLSAMVLAPLTPVILALAGAIALLGVGVLAIGTGLLAFSAGLAALAVSGTAGAAALVLIVESLAGLIPMIVQKIAEGIIEFAKTITDGMPTIMAAVKAGQQHLLF